MLVGGNRGKLQEICRKRKNQIPIPFIVGINKALVSPGLSLLVVNLFEF
jgi:hypothetical protein